MALAGSDLPQRQHPWIDTFLENPAEGLADLLSGYARIEPYVSAERPDAARMLFGGGSLDAMDAFVRFRGRQPDVRPLLKQTGIAA